MNTKELGDLSPTNFDGKTDKKNIGRKSNSKLVGDEGERIACQYLVKKGYNIIAKKYWISFGEIDIIAKKRWRFFVKNYKTIHFIEVKTIIGNDNNFFPEEKVNYKKQKKLRQLSQIWLENNKFPQYYPCQIDIIGVLIGQNSKKAQIHFFQNVVEDK